MGSLFSTLLRMRMSHELSSPVEDYFTQVVAHAIRCDRRVLDAFRRCVDPSLPAIAAQPHTKVEPQRRLGTMPTHRGVASIPDIIIQYLCADGTHATIFIESKVDSGEHDDQLKRYADHLARETWGTEKECRVLAYITKKHDPKPRLEQYVQTLPNPVRFFSRRWSEFCIQLKLLRQAESHDSGDQILGEIIDFMEEHDMASQDSFTADDLTALKLAPAAFRLLSYILPMDDKDNDLIKDFRETVGNSDGKRLDRPRYHNLLEWRKYVVESTYGPTPEAWVCLGLQFAPGNDDLPSVGIWVWADRHSGRHEDLRRAMDRTKSEKWDFVTSNGQPTITGMAYKRSLGDFLDKHNEIAKILSFLKEALDDFKRSELRSELDALSLLPSGAESKCLDQKAAIR